MNTEFDTYVRGSAQFLPDFRREYQTILENGSIYYITFFDNEFDPVEEEDQYYGYTAYVGYSHTDEDKDEEKVILYIAEDEDNVVLQREIWDGYTLEKIKYTVSSIQKMPKEQRRW